MRLGARDVDLHSGESDVVGAPDRRQVVHFRMLLHDLDVCARSALEAGDRNRSGGL